MRGRKINMFYSILFKSILGVVEPEPQLLASAKPKPECIPGPDAVPDPDLDPDPT
jgi:hypothetical protein